MTIKKMTDQPEDNLLLLQRIIATKVKESYWNKLGEIVFQPWEGPRGGLMVDALVSGSSVPGSNPGARFSKAPETFQARKAIVNLYPKRLKHV